MGLSPRRSLEIRNHPRYLPGVSPSNSILLRNTSLPCTDLDGELVFLGLDAGKYFGLKGTGRRIWELLETPMSTDTLLATLAAEYGIDLDRCRTDALPFLDRLLQNGLLTPSPVE